MKASLKGRKDSNSIGMVLPPRKGARGPRVVFVLSDVRESLLDQTKAHVVGRVHRRDFIGCKRLGFKQRDGRLGLGALGVSLQPPYER